MLSRDDHSVLGVALNLEMSGNRKRGRPKKTLKKQVKEETEKFGLKKENALNRDKWRDGGTSNCRRNEWIRSSLLRGQHRTKPKLPLLLLLLLLKQVLLF